MDSHRARINLVLTGSDDCASHGHLTAGLGGSAVLPPAKRGTSFQPVILRLEAATRRAGGALRYFFVFAARRRSGNNVRQISHSVPPQPRAVQYSRP